MLQDLKILEYIKRNRKVKWSVIDSTETLNKTEDSIFLNQSYKRKLSY